MRLDSAKLDTLVAKADALSRRLDAYEGPRDPKEIERLLGQRGKRPDDEPPDGSARKRPD
jgi:hypothetical protein